MIVQLPITVHPPNVIDVSMSRHTSLFTHQNMRYLTCMLCVFSMVAVTRVRSQSSEVALHGGIALNAHAASFTQLGNYASCCPEFSGGSGFGYWFGAGYRLSIAKHWLIGASLIYNSQQGTMDYSELSVVADLRDTPRVRQAEFLHELTSTVTSLGIEPHITFRVGKRLDLSLGMRIASVFTHHFTQRETLQKPEDYGEYLGAGRTWVNHDADIPDATSIYLGLLSSIRYAIPLNKSSSWLIQPEIAYIAPFSQVTTSASWSTSDLRFGIGIAHVFGTDTAVAIPDTIYGIPQETQPPSPPPLPDPPVASIQVRILNDDSNATVDSILVEETKYVDYLPVLPHVYFDLGSSTIPQRFRVDKNDLTDNTKYSESSKAIQSVLLTVAKRLMDNPKANITLTGCTSEAESSSDANLARNRALAVQAMLVELGVAKDRIDIKARKLPLAATRASKSADQQQADEENQRVEILSSDLDILQPMVLSTVDTTITPDSIVVHGRASADGGIKYSAAIPFTSVEAQSHRWEYTVAIPSPRRTDSAFIEVTDSLGRIARASQTIPVSVMTVERKLTEQRGNAEIERYSLILFDFDKADITPAHQHVLAKILKRIREGALVQVYGMTDSMGSDEYNMDLSRRRAMEVARALGLTEDLVYALGARNPRFSNDTPEGRAYNRTVIIEIHKK